MAVHVNTRPIACAIALLLPAAAAAADCPLPAGEVRVATTAVAGSGIPQLTVHGVLAAPPERVWAIVDDCSSYRRSMPKVMASREILRSGAKSHCETTVRMPFPFSNLEGVSESVSTVEAGRWLRTFRHLRGDYHKNDGQWLLTACGPSAEHTWVEYRLHSLPKVSVPDGLMRRGQIDAMHEMFGKIKALVKP